MPAGLDGGATADDPGRSLLRIHDLAGHLHGLGVPVDPQGTVLTVHEAVAGLERLVLHVPGGQTRVLGPDSIVALPEHGLALLRTDAVGGLPVPPLPVAAPPRAERGDRTQWAQWAERTGAVLVPDPAGQPGALAGAVLGGTTGGYAWAGRFHLVGGVLLVDLPGVTAVPAGTPVLDAASGALVALAAPSVRSPRQGGTFPAVPAGGGGAGEPDRPGERAAADPARGPLAEVLARNAAAVPAYGPALNPAGVLRLAAAQLALADAGPGRIAALAADRVDRPDGLPGDEPAALVTALVGAPGSGRSTELGALALRRTAGPAGRPTLWLRGADLPASTGDDEPGGGLAQALDAALARAAQALEPGRPAPGAERAARLCAAAHRPLLVVLDGPEEAPVPLDARWLRRAADWLADCGARLLTGCGEEAWERLTGCGEEVRERPAAGAPGRPLPLVVHRLGPLPAEAAERVRRRYGLPAGRPAPADARHPLAVRLAGELWAEGVHGAPAHRGELFSGYLDLRCLRVAERIARADRPRRPGAHRRVAGRPGAPGPAAAGPAAARGRVRRLSAAVAGRVHEAARRMLGTGSGSLDRAAFEELFPVAGGWAAAVVAEGLFVPAGPGYRPAHGEFGDWLQGRHLDLDAALRLLLGEEADTPPTGPDTPPAEPDRAVPRHRIGPVAAALARIADLRGPGALDPWLHRLRRALELRPAGSEPGWWASRLLAAALTRGPYAAEHPALLARLADRIAERAGAAGGFDRLPTAGLGHFGPAFWTGLGLPPHIELDLLRRLVPADGPGRPFLAAAAARLAGDPATVIPLLCRWFDDPRGVPGGTGGVAGDPRGVPDGTREHGDPGRPDDPGGPDRPAGSVADLAHALLYAHRRLALDDLTEALADAAHPRADALLAALAAAEPSALCRAVDRWSHDRRPERHVAAAAHALHAVPYASGAGLELLRHTARVLLAREDEPALHGAALALLVADPEGRAAHLPAALERYRRGGDAFLTARALAPALESHPEPVLAALAARLAAAPPDAPSAAPPSPSEDPSREPSQGPPDGNGGRRDEEAGAVLRVLAGVRSPAAARLGGELVGRLLRERPALAGPVAVEYLARRLAADAGAASGPALRLELRLLLGSVLAARSPAVRRAFAGVLAGPGPSAGGLRGELLDTLLAAEGDHGVLGEVLERLADAADPPDPPDPAESAGEAGGRGGSGPTAAARRPARVRARVARAATGLPPAEADALLVRCAARSAAFALLLADWPDGPGPALPGGPLTARMRALTAAGRAPQDAAAEAVRAAPGADRLPAVRPTRLPVPEPSRAHGTL